MQLSNQSYDLLKWVALVFLPAFSVLIGGLGPIFNWSMTEKWVTLVNLLAVFLGSLLQLSSNNYHNQGGGHYAIQTSFA